jgi:cytochrome c553
MRKSTLFMLGLVLAVGASLAFTSPTDRIYKNLKVLPKDITKPQMDSVMQSFTASLGVKCNFCHTRTADNKEWDFPSDANKHKLVTRNMMKMTSKINKKYFDMTGKGLGATQMVTCYTCHNGKPEPATKAPRPNQNNQNNQPRTDSTRRQ